MNEYLRIIFKNQISILNFKIFNFNIFISLKQLTD